jgi:hypothetical protein
VSACCDAVKICSGDPQPAGWSRRGRRKGCRRWRPKGNDKRTGPASRQDGTSDVEQETQRSANIERDSVGDDA